MGCDLKLIKNYNEPTNFLLEEGKAEMVKWYEDLRAFQDSIGVCHFSVFRGTVNALDTPQAELMAKYYNSITGKAITGQDVLRIGERIYNLEKAFNIREGWTREDDCLPERMLKEPLPDGPAIGQVVDLEPMLLRYYELRGWDGESGLPTRRKLLELDLADIADELESKGLLAQSVR